MKPSNRLLTLAAITVLAATGCDDSAMAERPRLLSVDAAQGIDLVRLEKLTAGEPARLTPARLEVKCPSTGRDAVRID
jgi:hypothetical protein